MTCFEVDIEVIKIFKHRDEAEVEGVANLSSEFLNSFINYFAILPIMCCIILETLV